MNEIMNMEEIRTTDKTPIEIRLGIDEEGRTTAKKLYEFLEMDPSHYSRWYKMNITENAFAVENVDFWPFATHGENLNGGRPTQDAKLTATFAKKLSMVQKNERGEEARNYFVTVENKAKEAAIQLTKLSPQLQLLISIETEQRRQARAIEDTNHKLNGISNIVALNSVNWRQDAKTLIAKIALRLGGYEYLRDVQAEIYKALDERFSVSLETRLTNKRRRMADEGVCKSKRDKLTKVDVIAEDKKLIEGYVAITKEMAIKYGVADEAAQVSDPAWC